MRRLAGTARRRFLPGARATLLAALAAAALSCPASTHPAAAAETSPHDERDEWFLVRHQGRTVGYTHTAVSRDREGWRATVEATLRLRNDAGITEMSFTEETAFDRGLAPTAFRYRQWSGAASLEATGRRVADGMEITLLPAGGVPNTRLLASREPIFPMAGLWFFLSRSMGGKERSFTVNGLVEPLAALTPVTVTIGPPEKVASGGGGHEVRRVTVTYSGYTETSWVTADGRIVAEVSGEGLESVPAGAAEARAACDSDPIPVSGFLASVSVKPDRPLPSGDKMGEICLRADGLPPEFPLPGGAFQRIAGQEAYRDPAGDQRLRSWVTILAPAPPEDMTAEEPRPAAAGEAGLSVFLQNDHPAIRRLAAQITGSLRGDWARAAAVGRWVHDNIKKDMTEAFSSTQVLEAGKGECQSHALLMAGLCRAAGVPARVVAGLVWLEAKGALFYHSWVEICHGRVWYPMDPTLGQFPAATARLKLLDDGVMGQWRLLGVVNRITLWVTDVRSGSCNDERGTKGSE